MMYEFLGYHRDNGRVGVRNLLLVLSTGGLTSQTARRVANMISGAVVVTMPYGSGLVGQDSAIQSAAIAGLAGHPNVGAALIIGDNDKLIEPALAWLRKIGKPHAAVTLDGCLHDALTVTDRGLRAGARLAREISGLRRKPAPVSALMVGMECGRSDPSSGLVANPLVGMMADRIVDVGGTAIIGETLEWLGAEHLLMKRARSPEVAAQIRDAVLARERAAMQAGIDLTGSNPTPTNIAAGLSSIEEKSLGNIAKSGSRPFEGLLGYGEAVRRAGLWAMDGAAYSPESMTGFVMSGAQLILFTTGVGNSYVSLLAPTVKISANPASATQLGEQLDFDASAAFRGRQDLSTAADALFATLLDIASGQATWGEVLHEGDEVLSRYAPAL